MGIGYRCGVLCHKGHRPYHEGRMNQEAVDRNGTIRRRNPPSQQENLNVDKHLGTIDICASVEPLLDALPKASMTTRENFFALDNLWKLEIPSTCDQILEHYMGILLIVERNLSRPAAALSRNIHEAAFRFVYLASNEDELPSWVRWQMARDYHSFRDALTYDTTLNVEAKRNLVERIGTFEYLLDGRPRKPAYPWKETSKVLRFLNSNRPNGIDRRLQRTLITYPSQYVHIRVSAKPSTQWVVGWAETSVLACMQRAMELCVGKQLLTADFVARAESIVGACKTLLRPDNA